MIRILIFLFVALGSFTECSKDKSSVTQQKWNSGLKIENGPTRGMGFSDLLGMKYGIVYITSTMTNDTTIPMQLELDVAMKYDYPEAYGEEHFNILPLSKEWGMNGIEITDSMILELSNYMNKPSRNITINPGESYVTTIGIIRPVRPDLCSATPYALMEYGNWKINSDCNWKDTKANYSDIGLKVGFCTVGGKYEHCIIIPCGQVSFPEQ